MSHQIEIVNGQARMLFAGKLPWHGLGQEMTEADLYDWTAACTKSGMAGWDLKKIPLRTVDEIPVEGGTAPQQVEGLYAIRRKTDNKILGTVGERYTIVQNEDAFRWFEPFLIAKEAQLHTCGSLAEGSRVWVLAKLNRDPLVIATGDEVNKFVLLSHSHDGSLSIRVGFTPIRVVCANTLALAHKDKAGSKLIRMKHTPDVHINLDNVRNIMNLANEQFEATAEQYRLLARKSVNAADLRKYVLTVINDGVDDGEAMPTRTKNILADIIGRCESGKGNTNPAVRGSLWTAYNGISEWLAYERGHNAANRLNSLWYGDGANVNQLALQTALAMCG